MICTIEAKILPLAGVSGHLYLEVFDENGCRIAQINGLATDKKTLETKSVGFPGDLLKTHVSDSHILASTASSRRENHRHEGCVLFSGTREEIDRALTAAQKRAAELNTLDLPYKLLSLNSNTVFMEMVKAIAKEVDLDWKALKAVTEMRLSFPGLATDFNMAIKKISQTPPQKPRPPKTSL